MSLTGYDLTIVIVYDLTVYDHMYASHMILEYDKWLRFVNFTKMFNCVFTCESKNARTGVKKLIPIFGITSLVRGSWEYSIESYHIMSGFKWGTLRSFVGKEQCKLRIQIEDVVE